MTGGATRVLVAGGGVAAFEALLALRELAGSRVALALLAPERELVYRPLSTADPFALGATRRYPLDELCERIGVERHEGTLAGVDAVRRTVRTGDGGSLEYDELLIAVGARPVPAYEHALTFTGPDEVEAMHGLVRDVEDGYVHRVAFVVPPGVAWSLPAYELALLLAGRGFEESAELDIAVVTAEPAPLAVFGPEGSRAVADLLARAEIRVEAGAAPDVPFKGRVRVGEEGRWLDADRVVALPRLAGPRIPGLPADPDGFLRVDEHARVAGVDHVYAAGDATAFPVKQGGIATQEADAAAEAIAAGAGAAVQPQPFRPVLRGVLLTDRGPRRLGAERGGDGAGDGDSGRSLWWPPDKIGGRRLSPFLGFEAPADAPEGLAIEVPLAGQAGAAG